MLSGSLGASHLRSRTQAPPVTFQKSRCTTVRSNRIVALLVVNGSAKARPTLQLPIRKGATHLVHRLPQGNRSAAQTLLRSLKTESNIRRCLFCSSPRGLGWSAQHSGPQAQFGNARFWTNGNHLSQASNESRGDGGALCCPLLYRPAWTGSTTSPPG